MASGQAALASFELSLHPVGPQTEPVLPDWLPAAWAANSSALGLVALAMVDATQDHATLELRLGTQALRIARLNGLAVC
jgi:hypothetical protein